MSAIIGSLRSVECQQARSKETWTRAPSLRRQRHARESAFADLNDVFAGLDLQTFVRDRRAVDAHAALLDVAQRFARRCREPRLLQQLADRERRAGERDRRDIVGYAAFRTVIEIFERALGIRLRVESRDRSRAS